ncbi:hypothetical protein AGMMS49982_10120 [Bacteroidia bacterium]|nr:hypothetical protein AGMMS49982_10120 [Bacteroidia bacterium]
MDMKKNWLSDCHVWLIIIIAFICVIIALFVFRGIGDIIGGITSPIVGLVTIGLLYSTLRAQNKHNEFNRLLDLQTQIQSLNNQLIFKYTTSNRVMVTGQKQVEGRGIFDFNNLDLWWYKDENPSILYSRYQMLMRNVELIDTTVRQFINLIFYPNEITPAEKTSFREFAKLYIEQIQIIYTILSIDDRVDIIHIEDELFSLDGPDWDDVVENAHDENNPLRKAGSDDREKYKVKAAELEEILQSLNSMK